MTDRLPRDGSTTGTGLRIGMVVYGDLTHDSRVQREAGSLAGAGHSVTIYCLAGAVDRLPGLDPRVSVVIEPVRAGGVGPGDANSLARSAGTGRLRRTFDRLGWLLGYARSLRSWGRRVARLAGQVDVWHAHDLAGLVAISAAIGPGSDQISPALVYDVHDLFVETGSAVRLPGPIRRLLRRYERHLVRRVDLVVAVNRELARVFAARCDPRTIIVVHNCPPVWAPETPARDLIREAAGIAPGTPLALYHGLLGGNRGIERMCESILEPGLERAHLALLGYGPMREPLADLAAQARFGGRIHLLDAVPPTELLAWVASADVGLLPMPRTTLNLFLSTPNKLFECLAAGVPVVVSDFPAVREIVVDDPLGPLGSTCDPSQVAEIGAATRSLLELAPLAMADLRARCARAARERWNWEAESAGLVAAYARLAAERTGVPGA